MPHSGCLEKLPQLQSKLKMLNQKFQVRLHLNSLGIKLEILGLRLKNIQIMQTLPQISDLPLFMTKSRPHWSQRYVIYNVHSHQVSNLGVTKYDCLFKFYNFGPCVSVTSNIKVFVI